MSWKERWKLQGSMEKSSGERNGDDGRRESDATEKTIVGNNGVREEDDETKIEESETEGAKVFENEKEGCGSKTETIEEEESLEEDDVMNMMEESGTGNEKKNNAEKVRKKKKKRGDRNGIHATKVNMGNISIRKKKIRRNKKILGPCSGYVYEEKDINNQNVYNEIEESDNKSDTISTGYELGNEGQRRERIKEESIRKDLEEANSTIEVGSKVGVTFNPDPSSAIEKLLDMEKSSKVPET